MYKKQQILILTIVTFFWFGQYIFMPYQTPYLTGLGLPASFVGTAVGAYGLTQMLCRFPLGIITDKVNRHKLFITIGILCICAAAVIRIFLPTGYGFLIANFFTGVASSVWISFVVFFTSLFPEDKQQKASALLTLFNNLGMLLGFVCATFTYKYLGMSFLCKCSLAGGIAACVIVFFVKNNDAAFQTAATPSVRKLLSVCKNRHLLIIGCLALIQQGIQLSTTMSFSTQILKDLGASDSWIGYSSIAYMVSSVVFAFFASSNTFKKRQPIFWVVLTYAVITCYCILVPTIPSLMAVSILQLLPGMSTGMLISILVTASLENIPAEMKSTATGLFQSIYSIGMTVFPLITGKIADYSSMKISYYLLACTSIAGIMISLFVFPKKTKEDKSSEASFLPQS